MHPPPPLSRNFCKNLPTSLHIGVTGHRDLLERDKKQAIESVEHEVQCLVENCRKSASVYGQITLHTPIAPGADQWVLEAFQNVSAKEHNRKDSVSRVSMRVQVILPMPWDEYLDTIANDNYRRETVNIWENLDHATPIVLPDKTDDTIENKYQLIAPYFSENCHLVIGVWDGLRSVATNSSKAQKIGGAGGTADTIDTILHLSRVKPEAKCLRVLCLVLPRESNPYPTHEPFTWRILTPPSTPTNLTQKRNISHWVVLLALAVASLFTGCYGYISGESKPFWHSLTVTASHLFLGSLDFSNNGSPHHWLVTLSRLLGLVFFVLTAKELLEKIIHLSTRFHVLIRSFCEHDLICGLGWRGQALLNDVQQDSPAIAIDYNPETTAHCLCKHRNTPLLTEDACLPETLLKTGLDRTRRAFVFTGSDEINQQVVHKLATHYNPRAVPLPKDKILRLIPNRLLKHTFPKVYQKKNKLVNELKESPPRLVCSVGLESMHHFESLRCSLPKDHKIDLRIFNTETATARLFLREHHIDRFTCINDCLGAHVLIIGDSPMAETLTRTIIQTGIYEADKTLKIMRLVKNAHETAKAMIATYPCYKLNTPDTTHAELLTPANEIWKKEKVLPDIELHDLPCSKREMIEWGELHLGEKLQGWATTVIVARQDPAVSLSTTTEIAPALETLAKNENLDIALWFLMNTPDESIRYDTERKLDQDHSHLHISAFSDFLGICSRLQATCEETDAMARRVNAAYYPGLTTEDAATELWNKLTEDHKDSSRQCAEHCVVKLRIRKRLASHYENESIQTQLSQIEHRRWCAEKLLKGFRPLIRIPNENENFTRTTGETQLINSWFTDKGFKKSQQKLLRHVDLVPFSDFYPLFEGLLAKDGIPLHILEISKDDAIINNLVLITNGGLSK